MFMRKSDYKRMMSDHCVLIQHFVEDKFVILLLYVDGMVIIVRNALRITKLKRGIGNFLL